MSTYYAYRGTYARLGGSCQTSMDTPMSNMKYFPIGQPVYMLPYTNMKYYPLNSLDDCCNKKQENSDVNITVKREKVTKEFSCESCGGK